MALHHYKDLYKSLAYYFHYSVEEEWLADKHLKDALDLIVDTKSDSYGEDGTDLVIRLFNPVHMAWRRTIEWWQRSVYVNLAVTAINQVVTEYYEGDLTDFVDSISWDGGCIPEYWGQLCEETNFDITGWEICTYS